MKYLIAVILLFSFIGCSSQDPEAILMQQAKRASVVALFEKAMGSESEYVLREVWRDDPAFAWNRTIASKTNLSFYPAGFRPSSIGDKRLVIVGHKEFEGGLIERRFYVELECNGEAVEGFKNYTLTKLKETLSDAPSQNK